MIWQVKNVSNSVLSLLSRDKLQRDAVIAIAKACRTRAVFEDMALMSAAAGAVIFRARDKELPVNFGPDIAFNRLEERRPARAGFIFCVRFKKRQLAACAGINTFGLILEKL